MSAPFRRAAGAALAALLASSAYPAIASTSYVPESVVEVSKKAGLGRVEVHGPIGAVLQRDEGTVAILDTRQPGDPKVVGRYDTAKDSLDGELAFSHDGKWLFYARQTRNFDEEGLHVLDVSDPKNPTLAFYQPAGGSYRVEYIKQGDAEWVVLLDAIDGLVVYRFNPQSGALVPVHVDPLPALKVGGPASADMVYDPKDAQTGKPLLYVTTGKTGLQVFDFSSPAAPVELATWDEVGLAEIEVHATKGSRIVFAATEYWFDKSLEPDVIALDASDFGKVVERRRISLNLPAAEGNFVQGMALGRDRLYVAHSTKGLVVFDTRTGKVRGRYIQTGTRNEAAGVQGGPYAIDVELVGGHLYLTDAALGTLTTLRR